MSSDGRQELNALAADIANHISVADVWTARAAPTRIRKTCGICERPQMVQVPFLRHTCVSCGALWSPVRCDRCTGTTVVFLAEPKPDYTGTCGCGGTLTFISYIPKQRTPRPEETDRSVLRDIQHGTPPVRRASRIFAAAAVAVTVLIAVTAIRAETQHPHPKPTAPAAVAASAPVGSSPTDLGAAAAGRIIAEGQVNNAFACQAAYINDAANTANNLPSADAPSATDTAFIHACTTATTTP